MQVGGSGIDFFSSILFNEDADDRLFVFGYSEASPMNQ